MVAGVLASSAQVYSANVVGYVNKVIPAGYIIVANPLDAGTNNISNLIPSAPDFTTLFKWNGSTFGVYTYSFGAWDGDATLNPGEACIISTTERFTNTFVGNVLQGNLTNKWTAGFTLMASKVPQAGALDDTTPGNLAFPVGQLSDFDTVFYMGETGSPSGAYQVSTWSFGAWDTTPVLSVGEGFWLSAAAGGSWVRSFTVQ